MHPLVMRVARVFGRGDEQRAEPPPLLIHPAYWQAMDRERATSPAGDAAHAEWLAWLTGMETREREVGDRSTPDVIFFPRDRCGLER